MSDLIKEQNANTLKANLRLIAKRLFRLVFACAAVIGIKLVFNSFEPIDRFDFFITIAFAIFLWVLLIAKNKI